LKKKKNKEEKRTRENGEKKAYMTKISAAITTKKIIK